MTHQIDNNNNTNKQRNVNNHVRTISIHTYFKKLHNRYLNVAVSTCTTP